MVAVGFATGTRWVEARDAAKHPTRHRAALPQKRTVSLKMSIVPRLKYSELNFFFPTAALWK